MLSFIGETQTTCSDLSYPAVTHWPSVGVWRSFRRYEACERRSFCYRVVVAGRYTKVPQERTVEKNTACILLTFSPLSTPNLFVTSSDSRNIWCWHFAIGKCARETPVFAIVACEVFLVDFMYHVVCWAGALFCLLTIACTWRSVWVGGNP